jgi:hypothetical protein
MLVLCFETVSGGALADQLALTVDSRSKHTFLRCTIQNCKPHSLGSVYRSFAHCECIGL